MNKKILLSELSKEREESLIKSFAQREGVIRYLSFEQVFIRSSPEDELLEKAFEEWAEAEKDKFGKK